MITCIFWMNPFFWIIQRELNLIHEFIADEQAIDHGDLTDFARMLLRSHNDGRYLDPSHSFFASPIKRRIMMITESNANRYSYFGRVLILPIVALVLFMLSFNLSNAQSESKDNPDSSKIKKIKDEQNAGFFDKSLPQNPSISEAELKEIVSKILKDPPTNRIFFINGEKVSPDKVKKLNYEMIADLQMLPPEDAVKKFGVSGEKGVIAFLLKKR
jgi:hypothetical protein